jgi:hypothetical protein
MECRVGINAHRALYSASSKDSYLGALTVPSTDEEELRAVRDDIRNAVRTGFAEWSSHVSRQRLLEDAVLSKLADTNPALRPKFRMQGSWSYHTLNETTHEPPQEIDLDDGVFLPVSFLTQNGSTHPALASSAYFEAVEDILQPLCKERGWTLVREKPSCVRVEVRDGAHIDLALYAIPDDEFTNLLEKALIADRARLSAQRLDEELAFRDEVYPSLPADHIMLAHRDDGWKPSDPRKLENWFNDAVKKHGDQLRRVCRYLKGWRDWTWKGCRLSSISLMACVVDAYDKATAAPAANRDDKALEMIAAGLPTQLRGKIDNPVVPGQRLDDGWDDTDACRSEFVNKATELARALSNALAGNDADRAAGILGQAFGKYLPKQPDFYVVEESGRADVLTTGILRGSDEQRSPVKLGGENRYG